MSTETNVTFADRKEGQLYPDRPIMEALESRLLMSDTSLAGGSGFLGLGNYESFGMAIESAAGNSDQYTVATTGATYVLYRDGLDLYRRIDPHTNDIDMSNDGKGRMIARLEFDADVGTLTLDYNDTNRAIIESTKATFDFQSDSFFFVTAKESFDLTHNNLIVNAPYVAPIDPQKWDLDRLWTDGYGGSILASLSESTQGLVVSEDANSTMISLSVGDQTGHMAFPTKPYNFEGLYGQDSRPFVQFIYTQEQVEAFLSPAYMDEYVSNGCGVFVLWNSFYSNSHIPEPLDTNPQISGYNITDPDSVDSFVSAAHDKGFKVISYLYHPSYYNWNYREGHPNAGEHQDISTTLDFMRGFQQEYDFDGWYLDGANVGELIDDYNFIRQLRTDVGSEGIIYHHNSLDPWEWQDNEPGDRERRAIMIDAYVDYTLAGETGESAKISDLNDPYLRYFASGYGMSQAYSTIKRRSDLKTSISEGEKNRLFGENLNGSERNLGNTSWVNDFKPVYDIRAEEYQNPDLEFDPDISWPLGENSWFRAADNVSITDITYNSATFTWTTDAAADSEVALTDDEVWWPVEVLDANGTDSKMVTIHSINISSLEPETTYEFRIRSKNGETEVPDQIVWGYVGSFTTALEPDIPSTAALDAYIQSLLAREQPDSIFQTGSTADTDIAVPEVATFTLPSEHSTVPEIGPYLTFDYRLISAGDGDQMQVRVDGNTIWSVPISSSQQDFVSVGPINLSDYAGQTIVLEFYLDSTGNPNAAFEVDNILLGGADTLTFYSPYGPAKVTFYDTTDNGLSGLADAVSVRFGKNDVVSSITLGGTLPLEGLGIVIAGASSVGTINDARRGILGDLAFVASNAAIKSLAIKGAIDGYELNGLELGGLTFADDIDSDGDHADKTAVYVESGLSNKVHIREGLEGDVVTLGGLTNFITGNLTSGIDVTIGLSDNPKAMVKMTFDRVWDTSVYSAIPISSLTATEWLNSEDTPYEEINAPWIGKLTTKGRRANFNRGITAIAGNFEANLDLSGEDVLPRRKTLGSATVAGNIACSWDIGGDGGNIKALATGSSWNLDVAGYVSSIYTTDSLGGVISALYFNRICTKGHMTAEITASGMDKAGKSIVTFQAGSVRDMSLSVPGGINNINVIAWLNSEDTPYEKISAAWLNKLTIKGRKANFNRGITAIAGDFEADLELSGEDVLPRRKTLGSATVAGNIACSWDIGGDGGNIKALATGSSWNLDVAGYVSSIYTTDSLGGVISALYFNRICTKGHMTAEITASGMDKAGKSIVTFQAGSVRDMSLSVPGGINNINVIEWRDTDATPDSIKAAWLNRLTTKGRRANFNRGITAIAGNFEANLDLSGEGVVPKKSTLGSATIVGNLASGDLDIDGRVYWEIIGIMGRLTVMGTADHSTVRSTSNMLGLTLSRTDGSDFLAGIDSDVVRHATYDSDFDDNAPVSIKFITVKGPKLPKGTPVPMCVLDSNFSASSVGAVTLINTEFDTPASTDEFGIFARNAGTPSAIAGTEVKSVKHTDKSNGLTWTWKPTAGDTPGEVFRIDDFVISILSEEALPPS